MVSNFLHDDYYPLTSIKQGPEVVEPTKGHEPGDDPLPEDGQLRTNLQRADWGDQGPGIPEEQQCAGLKFRNSAPLSTQTTGAERHAEAEGGRCKIEPMRKADG